MPPSPQCRRERAAAEFARVRNAEIDASIAAVQARRAAEAFARERNAEIDASIAAVEAQRAAAEFARARNAEIDASIAAVQAAARRGGVRARAQRRDRCLHRRRRGAARRR